MHLIFSAFAFHSAFVDTRNKYTKNSIIQQLFIK